MKAAASIGAVLLVSLLCATQSHASDPMAMYARVDRVVLEPNTDSPQRIQVWGVYSLGMLGLRDGPMKFIYELRSGRAQLFDVRDDPDERRNVADLHAGQTRQYERTLQNWSAAQRQAIRAASAGR